MHRTLGAALVIALGAVSACGSKTALLAPTEDAAALPAVDAGTDPTPVVTVAVPYRAPPGPRRIVVPLGANLAQVDVALVMDTTGSMGASILNLKSNLSTRLLPSLKEAIPSVAIALLEHKDYPVDPFGSLGDFPARVVQTATTDVGLAQKGVGFYLADGGGDEPEGQIPAMWFALTGGALRWDGGEVPTHRSGPGRWGAADFRAGSMPVVVLITDADWHDVDHEPYDARIHGPPGHAELAAAFEATHAKFIDVTNGSTRAPEAQAEALSDATGSSVPTAAFGGRCGGECCTGIGGAPRAPSAPGGRCRLDFLHDDGSGVSDSVVQAIRALLVGSVVDVAALVASDPINAGGVDATAFIQALRALEEGDVAERCEPHRAVDTNGDGVLDTFVEVMLGTRVCFELLARENDVVPALSTAQSFDAWLDFVAMPGAMKLERHVVRFEVPAR